MFACLWGSFKDIPRPNNSNQKLKTNYFKLPINRPGGLVCYFYIFPTGPPPYFPLAHRLRTKIPHCRRGRHRGCIYPHPQDRRRRAVVTSSIASYITPNPD